MGDNYDDECSPSILVRYSSDNESEDMVIPADPRLVQQQLEAQGLPQLPPPPPASPVSGVSTTSTTPFPDYWSLERSYTPSPTFDSPGREEPVVENTVEAPPNGGRQEQERVLADDVELPKLTHTTLCTSGDIQRAKKEKIVKFAPGTPKLLRGSDRQRLMSDLDVEVIEDPETEITCCCGCFTPVARLVADATEKAFTNLQRGIMEWVLAYSGRPSSSRPQPQDRLSIAEEEFQEAQEFVNQNSQRPLQELLEENLQNQIAKTIEYNFLRSRKPPCLADQQRDDNGRIIYSKEYIDFMLYRDLEPLIDLRKLRYVEKILLGMARDQGEMELVEKYEIAIPFELSQIKLEVVETKETEKPEEAEETEESEEPEEPEETEKPTTSDGGDDDDASV